MTKPRSAGHINFATVVFSPSFAFPTMGFPLTVDDALALYPAWVRDHATLDDATIGEIVSFQFDELKEPDDVLGTLYGDVDLLFSRVRSLAYADRSRVVDKCEMVLSAVVRLRHHRPGRAS